MAQHPAHAQNHRHPDGPRAPISARLVVIPPAIETSLRSTTWLLPCIGYCRDRRGTRNGAAQ